MARRLTREQVIAMMAAQRAGVSKRELFESDVRTRFFKRMPREEFEKILTSEREKGTKHMLQLSDVEFQREREKALRQFDKARAIQELKKTGAKPAFIRETAKTVRAGQLEELR